MATEIKTYPQDRPKKWLMENPHEKWRCDIYPADGSDHHGVGGSEAEAIHNASLAYLLYAGRPAYAVED